MISLIGLSQRSPTPDEEYQSEAERELPGFALTKDSDTARGRHRGARSSLRWPPGTRGPCIQG